jgi:hypothetical protein
MPDHGTWRRLRMAPSAVTSRPKRRNGRITPCRPATTASSGQPSVPHVDDAGPEPGRAVNAGDRHLKQRHQIGGKQQQQRGERQRQRAVEASPGRPLKRIGAAAAKQAPAPLEIGEVLRGAAIGTGDDHWVGHRTRRCKGELPPDRSQRQQCWFALMPRGRRGDAVMDDYPHVSDSKTSTPRFLFQNAGCRSGPIPHHLGRSSRRQMNEANVIRR